MSTEKISDMSLVSTDHICNEVGCGRSLGQDSDGCRICGAHGYLKINQPLASDDIKERLKLHKGDRAAVKLCLNAIKDYDFKTAYNILRELESTEDEKLE